MSFEEFALGRFLMVAESLVAFRFVITANDYRQILSPRLHPEENVLETCVLENGCRDCLQKGLSGLWKW